MNARIVLLKPFTMKYALSYNFQFGILYILVIEKISLVSSVDEGTFAKCFEMSVIVLVAKIPKSIDIYLIVR